MLQVEGYYVGGNQLAKDLLSRHKVTGHEIKRRSSVDAAMMDKVGLTSAAQYTPFQKMHKKWGFPLRKFFPYDFLWPSKFYFYYYNTHCSGYSFSRMKN